MEREASQFAVGVMNNIGGFNAEVLKGYGADAITGHLGFGSGMKDKSTPKSTAKVFDTMKKPQKPRK